MSKRKITEKMIDPEKYHMNFCSGCNGLGKTFHKDESVEICQVCGGFGLVKKHESEFEKRVSA